MVSSGKLLLSYGGLFKLQNNTSQILQTKGNLSKEPMTVARHQVSVQLWLANATIEKDMHMHV